MDACSTCIGRGAWGLLFVLGALGSCRRESPDPPSTAPSPVSDESGHRVFFDDFRDAQAAQWDPIVGDWDVVERAYTTRPKLYALTAAGASNWADYRVEATVRIDDDRAGQAGIAGRVQGVHYYYELVLGRDAHGARSWSIRQQRKHTWTTLGSGPFDYQLGTPYRLRLVLRGQHFEAWAGAGGPMVQLGEADDPGPADLTLGQIGLVTYGAAVRFSEVAVAGDVGIEAAAVPWGAIVKIRDTTATFPGAPSGGWYVTPIHVVLRPSDGKVMITGFGRKGDNHCTGTTVRQVGETWILDPTVFDQTPTVTQLNVTPLNEQNLSGSGSNDVLYCTSHNPLADGRIFYVAGTNYPSTLPNTSPELGLRYARIFNPATGTFTRISTLMKGGQSGNSPDTRGMKWYPTSTLMPDGRVLIFGGFHWSTNGPGSKPNLSLEMFDPKVWDLNPSADPFTVLTQHEEGQAETPPTRGYTNVFVLPRPVPAGSAGGLARSVGLASGFGRVFLFNHEPGPSGTARLIALPNSQSPNNSSTEKGEGSSGVLLTDGRLMFFGGGHTGAGSARAYTYNPYNDSWAAPLELGVSRFFGDAVYMPDGKVMLVNGYTSEVGNAGDVAPPIQGDVRQVQFVDPYASPMTVSTLPVWPEMAWRGYHANALVLKDGRVIIGGGKDGTDADPIHNTGCEKNEIRIFTPPYLTSGNPRPVIGNVNGAGGEGQTITVGGGTFTVNFSGAALRTARGVTLMTPGALTHGFDMHQRYVPLAQTNLTASSVSVTPPESINVAPPGDYLLYLISDQGVPSVAKWIRLAAPAPCLYAVDGGGPSYLEAEARSRQSGPFVSVTDATVSGGKYLQVTEGSGNHTTVPDEGKVLWFDLNVSNGGNFFVYALANGPDASSRTAWVSVDGNADVQLTAPQGAWGWVPVGGAALSLTSGPHTLKVKVREDGLKIDKLALGKTAGAPSGQGGTALACNNSLLWSDLDVGAPGMAGSSSQAAGVFTVKGSGADVFGNGDSFHYLYQTVGGDVTITARVTGITSTPTPNNVWAKAGVMIRENTTAGARNVFTLVSATPANFYRFQTRVVANMASTSASGGNGNIPVWVRAVKTGGTLSGFFSSDGINWTAIGSPTAIALGASFTVGLAVTSHDDTRLSTATFDNVTVGAPSAPGPVTSLVATPGNSQVALTWSAVSGATSYTVKRGLSAGGPYNDFTQGGITATSYTNSPASNGTTYFYVVSASNAVGEGPSSAEVSATPTAPAPPPAPTNLMATAGNRQVSLGWTASMGATSYTVKRGLSLGGPYTDFVQANVTGTTFTNTGLVNGTAYFYVVSASNAGGESAEDSSEATATPRLPAPTGVTATPSSGQITVSWSPVTNASSYTVKRGLTSGVHDVPVSVTASPFFDTTVSNGTQYFYVVSASDGPSEGPDSTEVSATPGAGPSAPSNLAATVANGDTVTLTWTDNSSNETGFRVERKVGTGAFATLATKAANTVTHQDGPLTPSTYTYRVIATGSPDSGPSNEVVVVLRNSEADAYVRDGSNVDANFGANATIEAKNNTAVGNNRQSFVRFTLADLGPTVTSARLRLFGSSVTSAKSIAISAVSDVTWVEGTGTTAAPVTATGIDWNGKPAIGTQLSSLTVGTTAGFWDFDVTAYVQAQRTAGATKVSFAVTMLTSSTESPTSFNARESATSKPLLVVSSR
jgi:hypothetical protein